MALPLVPSDTTDLSHLKRRVLDLRGWAYAVSTTGSLVVAITSGSERATILASLAGLVLFISVAFRRSVGGRLDLALTIDAAGAAALWWLFGPVAAVDFVLFYVVATAALLLPRATARAITGSLLAVTLLQLVLHLPGVASNLPFYHVDDGRAATEEIVFRAILLVGTAIMFSSIARMLRRSQAAKAESEERFRSLVDASPDAIVVHDGAEVLFANPAASLLVGTAAPDDLLGVPIGRFFHPESIEQARRRLANVNEGQGVQQTEIALRRLDGKTIHVEAVDIPTTFGSKAATQVVLRDITEQRLAHEALRESEERYKSFFDGVPTALYRTTPDGRILDANTALVSLLGYPNKQSLLDLEVHDAYVRGSDRTASQLMLHQKGSLEDHEQELIRHDGSHIWVRDTSRIVADRNGSVLYYEGAMVDITERKRAENTTRRLIRILEATPDFVAIADEDGRFLYANQAARDFAGVASDEEIRHVRVKDVLPMEGNESLSEILENEIWNGVLTLWKPDGSSVPASTVVINHRDDEGAIEYFSAVARDISERIAAEARLEKLVRSKDDFVASVSHELRTPLTAVVGLTQELRDNRAGFTPEEMTEFISLIADQSAEVANIVEDLLVAARAEIGRIAINRTAVRLSNEIDVVLSALGMDDAAKVSVRAEDATTAWADPARLRQILRNLVTNAVRYGGEHIEMAVTRSNGSVAITVTDNGPGIPKDRARIDLRALRKSPHGDHPTCLRRSRSDGVPATCPAHGRRPRVPGRGGGQLV